jgi:hypothetical protein
MGKEVTLRNLNSAFISALFKSNLFYMGFLIYLLGSIILFFNTLFGGALMFIGGLIMLSADYNTRQKVLMNLQWKR